MDINGVIIKHVIFPAMEAAKGNRIREKLKFLKKTESLNRQELAALQGEKLRSLLLHCIEHVNAYKEYAFLKDEILDNPFRALEKFPVLTKQAFMEKADQFIADGVDTSRLIANRTGGSTGEPVRFYLDRNTVEYYEAARWRGLSWWDINIGDRSVMIWGSPLELNQQEQRSYRLKERYLKNRIMIPAYSLSPESIANYVKITNNYKPKYIYGYASALHIFAQLMINGGYRLNVQLKGVLSTAETLHDYQRQDIEKAFGCPVINEYGARDAGILAYECPLGGMHITAENAVMEIVDIKTGEILPYGNSGLVTVTDLNNYVMPRLRYQVGDIAALSEDSCPCGISLPLLQSLSGREDDTFITKDGTFVHGHYFNHIARNLSGISRFQVIQHDRDNLTLKVVPSTQFNENEMEVFKKGIYDKMGQVNLKIEYVDKISPSPSGKYRYAIREFPLDIH